MNNEVGTIEIAWRGPYDWPESRTPSPLDSVSGVYLWAVEGQKSYVATGCGITTRTVRRRVTEHQRAFLRGDYTIVDIPSSRSGIRSEIWHGMWAGHNSDARKVEFLSRQEELQAKAREQMAATKIFVAEVSDRRAQHRMEAAIMAALYAASKPYCDLPDRGMFLVGRRFDEPPITVRDRSEHVFHNLPSILVI